MTSFGNDPQLAIERIISLSNKVCQRNFYEYFGSSQWSVAQWQLVFGPGVSGSNPGWSAVMEFKSIFV